MNRGEKMNLTISTEREYSNQKLDLKINQKHLPRNITCFLDNFLTVALANYSIFSFQSIH